MKRLYLLIFSIFSITAMEPDAPSHLDSDRTHTVRIKSTQDPKIAADNKGNYDCCCCLDIECSACTGCPSMKEFFQSIVYSCMNCCVMCDEYLCDCSCCESRDR